MKPLHSQVQQPTHVIPHFNAFAFLYFQVSFSHLTIPVWKLYRLIKYRCKPSRTKRNDSLSIPTHGLILYSTFFFPHKSFNGESKVLCLIIDVRKNKHGTKLRTLIWKHRVSRYCHYSIKVELRKKETIEFVEQRSLTFFLKQIGGSWCRESHLKEEKGREERMDKIFKIEENISSFSFFFFFFFFSFFCGYGRFWFLEISIGLWVWWV